MLTMWCTYYIFVTFQNPLNDKHGNWLGSIELGSRNTGIPVFLTILEQKFYSSIVVFFSQKRTILEYFCIPVLCVTCVKPCVIMSPFPVCILQSINYILLFVC